MSKLIYCDIDSPAEAKPRRMQYEEFEFSPLEYSTFTYVRGQLQKDVGHLDEMFVKRQPHAMCFTKEIKEDMISHDVTLKESWILQFDKRFNHDRFFVSYSDYWSDIEVDEVRDAFTKHRVSEEAVTGEAAIRFYDLLMNPPHNPDKDEMIREALRLFPDPDEPTELDIDL